MNEAVERAKAYVNDPTVAQDTADIIRGLLAELSEPVKLSERLLVDLTVLDGTACAEEVEAGNGPCGVCTTCLRAEIEYLRAYVGSEDYRSDFQSAGDMRAELERLREALMKRGMEDLAGWDRTCFEIIVSESKKVIEHLRVLLDHAKCPNCDGSGSYPDPRDGSQAQCQWCYERNEVLAAKGDQE